MSLFNVTNAATGRTLHIRAACRTCARRIAVEHIALTGPTATWRDPEQTRVDFVGPEKGKSEVLTDSAALDAERAKYEEVARQVGVTDFSRDLITGEYLNHGTAMDFRIWIGAQS